MNKAQPWNINGVGFDARDAARDAARRQGKSLGEWLHGVIADHAEDHGLAPRAIGGQERIDAVTARLEQMGARPGADHARRATRARPDSRADTRLDSRLDPRPDPRGRVSRAMQEHEIADFDEEAPAPRARGEERRAARVRPEPDEGDDLLESAVAAMERRTARTERRTDQALASMAKLLEETQARREQEYGDVATLTRKLGELESNLSQRFAAVADNPIKGTLERLEARLDAIGRRGAAEAAAQQSAAEKAPSEPIRRLEDKLNTILEAVQPRAPAVAQASPAAMAAVQASAPSPSAPQAFAPAVSAPAVSAPIAPMPASSGPGGRRSLGDAISEISRRQRALEEPAADDRALRAGAPRRPDPAEAMVALLRGEMASLAAKVDDVRRDALLARQARPAPRDPDVDTLRTELAAIARTLGGLAPRGSIDALETSIATLAERVEVSRDHGMRESILRPVEAAVGDLRHSLHLLDPRETIGGMEEELRRIGVKVDGLSGHDGAGIDRLHQQMEALRETVASMAARPSPIDRIESQVAILAERLDHRLDQPVANLDLQGEIGAATDALRTMIGGAPRHFENIEARLDMLAGRLDQALAIDRRLVPAARDTRELEHLVRDLGTRFEAAQASGTDTRELEHLVRDLGTRFEAAQTPGTDTRELEHLVRDLGHRFEAAQAPGTDTRELEHLVRDLGHRFEAAQAPGTDTRELEHLVRDLGVRFEAAQAPGADYTALDSLQRQVEHLSERFERSETGLSALPSLAASMSDLFAHFEATRESLEIAAAQTAAQTARDVLKNADEDRYREPTPDPALRALQDQVEARTSSTMNAVHDMLGKVTERLAMMEHEIADVRQRPVTPEPAAPAPVRDANAAAPARLRVPMARPVIGEPREIRLGGMEPRPVAPAKPQRKLEAAPSALDTDRRADFIAAARRAAAAAQAEAAAAQRQAPTDKVARAGLLARSRDYVSTHKRPMLMSIAALMMALGVIALMERPSLLGGGIQLASAPARAARVALAVPAMMAVPVKVADASQASPAAGALSPSTLSKIGAPLANPIPGSDPIQTGSIPSLPSFAAGAPPPPPPRASLPPALLAAAQSGDIAAQYDLATRYADGRFVPRDMKLAVNWFEKAAEAGSAPAQYRLASLFEKGIGIGLDKSKARSLYTRAADAGNPRAMHNLAVLLADGDGHPDYAGAVGWFRKAAQFGVHDSQYNLAVLLARGLGAQQSLVQAYQWFAVAAATGDVDAAKKRDEVGLKMSANDLAVAKALAASFQPKIPDPAAVEVAPPAAGWDGAIGASRLNSARSKISSL